MPEMLSVKREFSQWGAWVKRLQRGYSQLRKSVQEILEGKKSYHSFPLNESQTLIGYIDDLIKILERQADQPVHVLAVLNELYAKTVALLAIPKKLGKRIDARLAKLTPEEAEQYDYTRPYVMKSVDNLVRVAERELGDPEKWTMLAKINDLSQDDIYSDLTGRTIYIPVKSNIGALSGRGNAVFDYWEGESYLGTGIKWDEEEGLKIYNGGFQTVSGKENLAQCLLYRLISERGMVALHPNYGTLLPILVGYRTGDPFWQAVLGIEVEEAVRGDPRVKEVEDISIEFNEGALHVNFTAVAYTEERVRIGTTI